MSGDRSESSERLRRASERFDYSSERGRHDSFVGRAELLARLDRELIEGDAGRWVVVTGGPGMGKSALLAAWLARREAVGGVVPHHFIRRGLYDWDDPAKLVGSLVAQLDDGFPAQREPEGDSGMHPATRLARALARVSGGELRPRGKRLVVLIDGLDEYDAKPGSATGDPLAAFLPEMLPAGVSVLCASRPRHPYVSNLAARDGELVQIDLDDPDLAASNDATVHAFWEGAAAQLELGADFVDEAVACAKGNVQHAVQLRKHLATLPSAQRRVEDIPRGLAALIERSWARVAVEPIAVTGLGLLCAAREALTLDELSVVAGWTASAQRIAFMHAASELLLETPRPNGEPEYRLHHDSIRGHIARSIGNVAVRAHHLTFVRTLARWPARTGATGACYALRHALTHCAEAGEWANAWRLASNMSFLEAKCRELGVHEAEADLARVAERRRASDSAFARRFSDLARGLGRDSHWLRDAPDATAAVVWNRLRRSGWTADELDAQLRVPVDARFLQVRHVATRESPALRRVLAGHDARVSACAVTPDGRRVVSASVDQTLKVWDLDSGRVLATLVGHAGAMNACAVTPDGRRVVSASADRMLNVWELDSGRLLATLQGHAGAMNACAVTPDGRRAVSASSDRTLKVWDLESGRVLATLEGHASAVRACAVTPDGRRAVSASDDRTLKIWELDGGHVLATWQGHAGRVRACAVTPDGRRVVSASNDGTLKVWDLESGRVLATLEGHAGRVRACAVTPDGRRVVSASYDGTLKVWGLESGRVLATLAGHAGAVLACVVTPDGQRVVSASNDQTLKVWDLDGGRVLATPEAHAGWVNSCAVTPDGRRVVSASYDGTLKVWDLESGRVLATLGCHPSGVRACAVTPDGRRVVSALDDHTLEIWDLDGGRVVAALEGHAGVVRACTVTRDGRRVVSASSDTTLKVWDLDSGRLLATLEDHAGPVLACAMTPDGRRVVSASEDRTLKVWDLDSGRVLATLEDHAGLVRACAVTPDGRRVVSASSDRTLKVWDLGSGRVLATLEGHVDWMRACAVTPDGRRVVSASDDRTLRVWDLDRFTCEFVHRGDAPYSAVTSTATSIIAGDHAGALWFLDWPRPIPSPRQHMKQHTILFLAANPHGTERLALDREARDVQVELERSGHRDCFEFITRWAAEPLDLLRELRKLKPTVVHFSGHGAGTAGVDATGRDVVDKLDPRAEQNPALFFQGPDSRAMPVSTAAIADTFGAAGASVKLVVLNACYSAAHAEALLAHVDCVVGMAASVHDDAARSFAIGFYGALGERESVAAAYAQGRAAMGLVGQRGRGQPQLRVRTGVDANQLVLAAEPRASTNATSASGSSLRAQVDVAILTIRDDEFRAVLDAFPAKAGRHVATDREYTVRYADVHGGDRYTVAIVRQVEQGTGEAQSVAADVIRDLDPKLLLVVGIAGGLPSGEVTLGDVVLSTRIHDFTVEARTFGEAGSYSGTGGPIDRALQSALANLAARDDELGDWTGDLPERPPVSWTRKGQLYGPPEWQRDVEAKLESHYGPEASPRDPRYVTGPIASSDRLIKDPAVLIPWLTTARHLLAVEMESAGAYRAARERCPMLAIRGISDIVGLKRSDAWTKFACASAAAFTRAFLRTRPVPPSSSPLAADP